ncbi:MAG: hypothetical protein K6G50_03630 [bacterium]|nr:hypothetical protein [bacterium]
MDNMEQGQGGGMDSASLKNKKIDGSLREYMSGSSEELLPVIVQTKDGLKDADRKMVEGLHGKVKDDLYIINAFSADLSPKAINMMILSERITRIFLDAEVHSQG